MYWPVQLDQQKETHADEHKADIENIISSTMSITTIIYGETKCSFLYYILGIMPVTCTLIHKLGFSLSTYEPLFRVSLP